MKKAAFKCTYNNIYISEIEYYYYHETEDENLNEEEINVQEDMDDEKVSKFIFIEDSIIMKFKVEKLKAKLKKAAYLRVGKKLNYRYV